MITLNNVSFTYGQSGDSIENINLNISKGEVVVLVGHSGSGKTTITRIINGLNHAFYDGQLSGQVQIDGKDADKLSMWERGKIIGSIFQDPRSQFFSHQVEGEIAFGCENYGYSTEDIRKRVYEAISSFHIENLCGKELLKLSNGEKQKTAIASIYATQPKIFVFDEPSSNLDAEATKHLARIIKQLKANGCTIIIAEHRLWYLLDIADRFIYLEKGAITAHMAAEDFKRTDNAMHQMLGLRSRSLKSLNKKKVKLCENESSSNLDVRHVFYSYNKEPLLKNITFSGNNGDIIAITGNNGTGKTTLAKLLSGLYREKKGVITIDGKVLSRKKRQKDIRFLPHDTGTQLFAESVSEELLLMTKRTENDIKKATYLLKQLDLYSYKDRHPATLSGGQKQRLVLAAAMMDDFRVLILDEPTSGLDGQNMLLVADALKQIAAMGKIVLVITHDGELVEACCTDMVCL